MIKKQINTSFGVFLLASIFAAVAASNPQGFIPIDLSRFATIVWPDFHPWASWNGPPGGLQRLDDVPFQIDGVMQFRALNPRAPGETLPTRMGGIPIGRRFTQLHLLHCSEFGTAPGEPVVKLVLHYTDKKEHAFLLRYGVHFQDWNHPLQAYAGAQANNAYAWIAPAAGSQGPPWVTALWHAVLVNPRPEAEVASFEVRSLFSQARYTLIAATTETGSARSSDATQSMPPLPSGKEPIIVRFHLVDADAGSVIAGARVQASLQRNSQSVPWETVETDPQGEAMLTFPAHTSAIPIELLATSPKHTTAKFSFVTDSQSIPSFKMRRGQTVGGRVIDERGRAVAGAAITIAGPQADDSGQPLISKWFTAITDSNGLWSLSCAPPEFTRLVLTIRYSKMLPAVIYEQDDTGGGPFSFRGKDLSERKAVFEVKAGIEFKGQVRCAPDAVPNAQVTLFYGETPAATRLTTRTDQAGGFAFPGLETGSASVLITGDGFAPSLQKLEINTNSVVIALERGRTIQAIVRDEGGRPLAHTLFQVASWKGDAWLQHFSYSDSKGELRWESAPAETVTFSIFHPGFSTLPNVPLLAGAAPRVITLVRQDQRRTDQ